jgi:hypothetical protein
MNALTQSSLSAPASSRLASTAFVPPEGASTTMQAFAELLKRKESADVDLQSSADVKREKDAREKARSSAETLVAQTLITPILAQLRESNKAAGPFGTTDAEKRLGPVFDERIATQIVQQARLPIVDNVERSILKASGIKVASTYANDRARSAGAAESMTAGNVKG